MSDVGEEERPSSLAEKGFDYSYIESGNVRQFGDGDGRAIHPVPGRHRPINRRGRLPDSQAVNRALSLIDDVGDVRATASARIARHEMRAQLFDAVIEEDRLPNVRSIIRGKIIDLAETDCVAVGLQFRVHSISQSLDINGGLWLLGCCCACSRRGTGCDQRDCRERQGGYYQGTPFLYHAVFLLN